MSGFDESVLKSLNDFVGRWPRLDAFLLEWSVQDLTKGGVFAAAFWALWFRRHTQPLGRLRLAIGATAITLALVVNRVLASLLPFVERPLRDPNLGFEFRRVTGLAQDAFGTLSSFPSDHAVLFMGLAVLFSMVSRRIGAALIVYATVAVLAPRVYLGLHAPSDLLAGTILGGTFALTPLWPVTVRRVGQPLLRLEATRPALFYSLAFLWSWMIATLFHPLVRWAEFLHAYWTT